MGMEEHDLEARREEERRPLEAGALGGGLYDWHSTPAAQAIAQRDRRSEARISAGMNIRAGGASNVAELTGRRLARPAAQISARISCATASAERIAPST